MDFDEKLRRLRKETGWTQEQLAEKLFVSRAAVSKWESGNGYPNIDSLKSISELFSVSIDDLLSGKELITLAEKENHLNLSKISSLVFGILDLMVLSFLFLPLYGQQEGTFVSMVSLSALRDTSAVTTFIFVALPVLLAVFGGIQLFLQHYGHDKWLNASKTASILLQAFVITAFITTRQPYAAVLLFLFFMVKILLLIRSNLLNKTV